MSGLNETDGLRSSGRRFSRQSRESTILTIPQSLRCFRNVPGPGASAGLLACRWLTDGSGIGPISAAFAACRRRSRGGPLSVALVAAVPAARRPHRRDGVRSALCYHTAWAAAGVLARSRPSLHVDISSACILWALRRPSCPEVLRLPAGRAGVEQSGGRSRRPDPAAIRGSFARIAVLLARGRDVGLGRYGDPLDPSGDTKAMSELAHRRRRAARCSWRVPIGRPRLAFNAHRIYSDSLDPGLNSKEWQLERVIRA